jgi:formylglycine-generating enzyme required for sulfatase activity
MIELLFALALLQDRKADEAVTIPGGVTLDLVHVPGGTVNGRKLDAFWIGKTEVAWEQFLVYYKNRDLKKNKVDGVTHPSKGLSHVQEIPGFNQDLAMGKYPFAFPRWHTAMGFCEYLTKVTGRYYRLPTEAEWELAARAGEAGPAPADLEAAAVVKENAAREPKLAGSKKANAWGIHDAIGNVWEYCLEFEKPTEYAPVLRGGAYTSTKAEATFASRTLVVPGWYESDPNRPRSSWWLSNAPFAGFRVVRVEEPGDWAAYAPKVEITILKHVPLLVKDRPGFGSPMVRVTGEVKNTGDRSIDELELMVYYLTPEGKPHTFDIQGGDKPDRATYSRCHPVLLHSAHDGPHRAALKGGEARAFDVEIPTSGDDPASQVDPGKFGARVSGLKFSK